MNMRTQSNSRAANRVLLNSTFFKLANGAMTLEEILAHNTALRAQTLTTEDDYMRRRRQAAEAADPFAMTYYR